MGFCRQNIKALYLENSFRKIEGKFLCLGRQTVNLNIKELEEIFNKNYLLNKDTLDKVTKHSKLSKDKRITDKYFLEKTFDVSYSSVDINTYEKANMNWDLNKKIPKKLEKKFDFIFSGGLLDNIFNPSNALLNINKMLKDDGRALIWEPSRGLVGSMLHFTPEYFYSYFAINNFKDVKVYLLLHTKDKKNKKDNFDYEVDVYSYSPKFTRRKNFDYLTSSNMLNGIHYVMAIVEKGKNSTTDRTPTNLHYIPFLNSKNRYLQWDKKIMPKKRNFFGKKNQKFFIKKKNVKRTPYNTDHYKYVCSNF